MQYWDHTSGSLWYDKCAITRRRIGRRAYQIRGQYLIRSALSRQVGWKYASAFLLACICRTYRWRLRVWSSTHVDDIRTRKKKVVHSKVYVLTFSATSSDWKSPARNFTVRIPGWEGWCPSAGMEPVVYMNFSTIALVAQGQEKKELGELNFEVRRFQDLVSQRKKRLWVCYKIYTVWLSRNVSIVGRKHGNA